MTDHRRIQRTLFRMQLDPGFAERVFALDAEAVASTDLGPEELDLLLATDPRAVAADPGGRRRDQVLGNVASEFELSLASATICGCEIDLLAGFPGSGAFHVAMRGGKRLAPSFARYVGWAVHVSGRPPLFEAAHYLELYMVDLRRFPVEREAPRDGEVVLAPDARVVRVARGTLAWASRLHAARESDPDALATPEHPLDPDHPEQVLLVARGRSPHRLPRIEPELLLRPARGLLRRCEQPLSRRARTRFARSVEAEPADLERFVDGLVEDGVLVRG